MYRNTSTAVKHEYKWSLRANSMQTWKWN